MEDTKIVPQWMLTMLQGLHEQRDKLQKVVNEKQAAYESARRACIEPMNLLECINKALVALDNATDWAGGTGQEVPL